MKPIFKYFVLLVTLLFYFSPASLQSAESFTLDPSHSFVLWSINHFGFSNPSGKWSAEGTLLLDEKNPKNSKVNITIPINSLVTGVPKLDDHLKESDFFDVARYPVATFVSHKVDVTSKNTANVRGELTIHGKTEPATLHMTLNKIGENPITHKKTVGFTGDTTLKRSDFGIDKYLPGLGNDVKIHIESEASLS